MTSDTGTLVNPRSQALSALAECGSEEQLRERLFGEKGLLTDAAQDAGAFSLVELAFRRMSDLRDEFKNREITDWKRVRASIEHENTLTNHRITWLFYSQGFLLTAYTLAFNEWAKGPAVPVASAAAVSAGSALQNAGETRALYPYLLVVIALSGFSMCLVAFRAIATASLQLQDLDNWWHLGRKWDEDVKRPRTGTQPARNAGRKKHSALHPPLQGSAPHRWYDLFIAVDKIPFYFMGVWLAILSLTGLVYASRLFDEVRQNWQTLVQSVTFALLLMLSVYALSRNKRVRDLEKTLKEASKGDQV